MEPYLSDAGSVLYDGFWNDCVASGWRRKASKERCFMAGLCHWIFVPFALGNKLIHVI